MRSRQTLDLCNGQTWEPDNEQTQDLCKGQTWEPDYGQTLDLYKGQTWEADNTTSRRKNLLEQVWFCTTDSLANEIYRC